MKNTVWLFILMMVFSCGEEVIRKPENLIPKDQMIEILYDLAIINAAKKTNPTRLVDYSIEAMPFIYDKYGIDSIQFVKSDIYYASIPSEYEFIYATLKDRLDKENAEFNKEKTKASDSIRVAAQRQRERLRQDSTTVQQPDTIP